MREHTASKTALMVAGYRARATARPEPICNDPWAAAMCGDEGLRISEAFDATFPHMELWMALRTVYLDRAIDRFTRAGTAQVVLLGAGFDTRAARLARGGVTFFEVDHPATQACKRERLASIDGYPANAALYAPCDFERGEDFLAQLEGVGFEVEQPAVIIWEGVTAYLSEGAVRATCKRVAEGCHPRTVLLFDYVGKRLAQGSNLREKDAATRNLVADLGEPIQFGTNDILPLLYNAGFRWVRSLSFDEICLEFTGSYAREREFRFQSIALASRTVPDAPQ